jgi:DNA-3-methyladenine glycosylase
VPFSRAFFERPTRRVARELLGARLTARGRGGSRTVRLVETEAYVRDDPANHAYLGPTVRNRSMFGPPGTLYVYRIHQVVCANVVTHPGEAVLLRAGAPEPESVESASGPGRLCRFLGITIADDGADLSEGRRFSLEPGARPGASAVAVGPRVGIRQAADRPLRFCLRGERAVSSPRPGTARARRSAELRPGVSAAPGARAEPAGGADALLPVEGVATAAAADEMDDLSPALGRRSLSHRSPPTARCTPPSRPGRG